MFVARFENVFKAKMATMSEESARGLAQSKTLARQCGHF
jgi:hypothetical protein